MTDHKSPELKNPLTAYYHSKFPEQEQPYPGLESKMEPKPDCGEKTYQGRGRLTGRKALVTGADSGIGRAVAIAFAREGADLALAYLPQEQPDADQVKQLVEAEGRRAVMIPGELSDEQYNRKMVKQAFEELGGLDTLALVAGYQVAQKSLEGITTEQLTKIYAVNVFSLFWTLQEAFPLMPEGAAVITTSSVVATSPMTTLLDYSSTKAAISNLTLSLAKKFSPKGIRVNCVAPGPIWTPLQVAGGNLPEDVPGFGQQTPLERAGQPVEVAPAYVYLASDESSYVTGQILGVTGGLPI